MKKGETKTEYLFDPPGPFSPPSIWEEFRNKLKKLEQTQDVREELARANKSLRLSRQMHREREKSGNERKK